MSIITSVFHIYGFLITEEAANLILRYTEKVFPDLYKEFSDPEPLLAFQEKNFISLNLKILPTYFHRRILLIRKLSKKFKKRLVNYFLRIFH